jgi:hypothetical protein
MEVWGSFLQMKTEEDKQREARWNKSNQLEECKLEIEERKLLWEQEQKIMFCDVSTMDDSQRAYVLALTAQIAKEKVALLSSRSTTTTDITDLDSRRVRASPQCYGTLRQTS